MNIHEDIVFLSPMVENIIRKELQCMKIKINFAVLLTIVLCITSVSIVIYALSDSSSNQRSAEDTTGIYDNGLQKIIEPKGTLSLVQMDLDITSSKLSAAVLKDAFSKTKQIAKEYDSYELGYNFYVDRFTRTYLQGQTAEMSISSTRETMSILKDTKQTDESAFGYLMLLSYITTEMKDCVVWTDQEYSPYMNRPMSTWLFISTDYESLGFSTVQAYYDAVKAGQCEFTDGAYLVSFETCRIVEYGDWSFTNLLE